MHRIINTRPLRFQNPYFTSGFRKVYNFSYRSPIYNGDISQGEVALQQQMIEKLKVVVKPEDWKLPVNELEMRCLKNLLLKVDELVDAVNEITTWRFETDDETPENRECAKNAQDPYNEQRQWIGKLCRFWDNDEFITSNDWAFGILTSIDKGMQYQYCCNENCNFKHCEPVLPTDNEIYKGGDNE